MSTLKSKYKMVTNVGTAIPLLSFLLRGFPTTERVIVLQQFDENNHWVGSTNLTLAAALSLEAQLKAKRKLFYADKPLPRINKSNVPLREY